MLEKILDFWPILIIFPAIVAVGFYGFFKHAIKHTDGSDDIQTADLAQKGLMSSVHATRVDKLENIGDVKPSAAQWGIVGALTTDPVGGDGTAGRILRAIYLRIENGTDAATLKCTVTSRWNGDSIAVTDNIVKDDTTGNFSLNDIGNILTIKASGLTGNALCADGAISYNKSGTLLGNRIEVAGNDIKFHAYDMPNGLTKDLTTLVDTGRVDLNILYVTDA